MERGGWHRFCGPPSCIINSCTLCWNERAKRYAHGVLFVKYAIMTDLEGPAGVERFSQTYGSEPFKIHAMRLLAGETNTAVQGIIDADPSAQVDVFDGHGDGGLNRDDLHPKARYIRDGAVKEEALRRFSEYAAFLYVGQHAMACMPNAPLCHTGSSKHVVYKRLNGVFVGEFGWGAAVAGSCGVPTVFLAGDDKAVCEAQGLIPGIYTVTTKKGIGWQLAEHLSHEEACRRIREQVALACANRKKIEPLRVDPPYSWEIRYIHPRNFAHSDIEGVTMTVLDSRTVLYRSDEFHYLRAIRS